jgi:hypothetical protein
MSVRRTRAIKQGSSSLREPAIEGVAVIGFKGSQAGFEQLAPRDDDHVEAGRDLISTENLTYQSLRAIPPDGSADLFRDRNPEAANPAIGRQDEQRAVPTLYPGAVLEGPLKLGAVADPFAGTEPATHGFSSLGTDG